MLWWYSSWLLFSQSCCHTGRKCSTCRGPSVMPSHGLHCRYVVPTFYPNWPDNWGPLQIVLAAISSALNLKFLQASPPGSRVTPGIVTVILDGILVYWLGYTATQNIESLSYWHASDRCYDYYKPGPSPARDECERFAERIKTVLWVYVGLLLLLT